MSIWLGFLVVTAAGLLGAGVSAARFRGRRSRTGAVAEREGRRVTVRGALKCADPLRSPVTGDTVLAYSVEVQATWPDGERLRQETVLKVRRVAPFVVDDGSGVVHVVVGPEDQLFPRVLAFDQTRKVALANSVTGRPETFGDADYAVDPDIVSGGADHLRVIEHTVQVPAEATVIGEVRAGALTRSRHFQLWVDGTGRTPLHLLTEHALPAVGRATMKALRSLRALGGARRVTGG